MSFLPEHVNPVLLVLSAMGVAALLDRRRWWLVGVPALIGLAIGLMIDVAGASIHAVPLVPFLVEVATLATLCGIATTRPRASALY